MAIQNDRSSLQVSVMLLTTAATLLPLLIAPAVLKGGWIDEYWTIWMTKPDLSFSEALWNRWLPDVGHPPLFNLIHWSLAHAVGDSLIVRRFVNLITLVVLLAPTLALMRPQLAPHHFRLLILLSVLASPFVFAKFAESRAYFTDAIAVLALLLTLRELFVRVATSRIGPGLISWLAVVSLIASNLDYTNAIVTHSLLGCSAVALWLMRRRRLAFIVAVVGVITAALLTLQLYIAVKLGFTVPSSQVPLVRGGVALAVAIIS